MLYADLRGHHGKRWNYEPSDWYMGNHKQKKKQENTMPMGKGTYGSKKRRPPKKNKNKKKNKKKK